MYGPGTSMSDFYRTMAQKYLPQPQAQQSGMGQSTQNGGWDPGYSSHGLKQGVGYDPRSKAELGGDYGSWFQKNASSYMRAGGAPQGKPYVGQDPLQNGATGLFGSQPF
jgi:hypothetical protein